MSDSTPPSAPADSAPPAPAPPAPGAAIVPGGYAPAYGAPAYYAPPTNTLSIISLVLSLVGLVTFVTAVGGIVCGHIALGQIARSGESGRGLAIGGLVAGYVVVGLGALFIVAYVIVLVWFLAVFGTVMTTAATS